MEIPRGAAIQKIPPEKRFEISFIPEPNSGCWLWLGTITNAGYGRLGVNKKYITAHRYSYVLHYGKIQEEMVVCHKCDNRICVNPDHLFLGTHAENSADMKLKKRQSHGLRHSEIIKKVTQRGINHHQSKITDEIVIEIRNLNLPTRRIAKIYGLSQSTICSILKFKTWKHVENENV